MTTIKINHFRYLTQRVTVITLMGLFILTSPVALAAKQDWQGKWKINDKSQYASINIDKVTDKGFVFFYDEGVGIRGNKVTGQSSFKDDFTAQIVLEECKLELSLSRNKQGKQLELLNCDLNYNAAPVNGYKFVPEATKLYYKASFNCARAGTRLEMAICNSRILAAADNKLGRFYSSLKKQLEAKSKKTA